LKNTIFKIERRQLAAEGKPIIIWELKSRFTVAVIDAIVDAMQDENAQYQSYQGLPELREGMADFMPKN
jgi:aspartate/methionine/tyrosine aminotransferase